MRSCCAWSSFPSVCRPSAACNREIGVTPPRPPTTRSEHNSFTYCLLPCIMPNQCIRTAGQDMRRIVGTTATALVLAVFVLAASVRTTTLPKPSTSHESPPCRSASSTPSTRRTSPAGAPAGTPHERQAVLDEAAGLAGVPSATVATRPWAVEPCSRAPAARPRGDRAAGRARDRTQRARHDRQPVVRLQPGRGDGRLAHPGVRRRGRRRRGRRPGASSASSSARAASTSRANRLRNSGCWAYPS